MEEQHPHNWLIHILICWGVFYGKHDWYRPWTAFVDGGSGCWRQETRRCSRCGCTNPNWALRG